MYGNITIHARIHSAGDISSLIDLLMEQHLIHTLLYCVYLYLLASHGKSLHTHTHKRYYRNYLSMGVYVCRYVCMHVCVHTYGVAV